MHDRTRRDLLRDSVVLGVAVASTPLTTFAQPAQDAEQPKPGKEPEFTATEDLMREHGVIRRALLVYAELVPKLRQNASAIDASAVRKTAQLFREFGENYHEKILEEQHIFPKIRKMGEPALTHYVEFSLSSTIEAEILPTTSSASPTIRGSAAPTPSLWQESLRASR